VIRRGDLESIGAGGTENSKVQIVACPSGGEGERHRKEKKGEKHLVQGGGGRQVLPGLPNVERIE